MRGDGRAIGITTTVPSEVVFAAGCYPVDLNNTFVGHEDSQRFIEVAHRHGFPQGSCAWLKGIFGAVVSGEGPRRVIGVLRGDCSGTAVLLEALEARGVEVIPFSYPFPPSVEEMRREIANLCDRLGTDPGEAEEWRLRLQSARRALLELDSLYWRDNKVTGLEAYTWLVSSSDFGGDPVAFEEKLREFIGVARERAPRDGRDGLGFRREVRLGYVGVPPVVPDIFGLAEAEGARFVFLEVPRQFSMPTPAGSLAEQYVSYTYPYSLEGRATDVNRESERRGLDGVVHYVQSFCHRNLEDVIFARRLDRPLLTIECDCPGELGATAKSRLENFIQVLGENL